MPIPLQWLVSAGLGAEAVCGATYKKGELLALVEVRYANRVLAQRSSHPTGQLARDALKHVILSGAVWSGALKSIQDGLDELHLADSLGLAGSQEFKGLPKTPEAWIEKRVEELGFESADDMELLDLSDILPPKLEPATESHLRRTFPLEIKLPDVTYRLEYRVKSKTVRMHKTSGRRREPPPVPGYHDSMVSR